MNMFKKWLNNATIHKKFIPLQCFIIASMVLISMFSFFSVLMVNISSERIVNENVRHKEQLSAIIRNMYVCRVLGRDILLQENEAMREDLYDEYILAFEQLDQKMDDFAVLLDGSQLAEFNEIIEQKNVYKHSMILSADIRMNGGEYDEALHALQVVTPIANDFFGSIDAFSLEEERLLSVALHQNDVLVLTILIAGVVLNILVVLTVLLFIRFFAKSMSSSLVTLEKAMSEIAVTGNMKIEIPNALYTKDEVGRIASVANKMKTMLLSYSFNDTLTGGYNAKAYHEELNDLFIDTTSKKEFWCVISDMNNLKHINDHLGHMEGDNAIRNSYHTLNNHFKTYGKTFRVGGDEFVSLLVGCTKEELDATIAAIVNQVERANIDTTYRFSLAIGFGYFSGNTQDEYNTYFKMVDQKMYDNKLASKQSRLHARVHPLPNEHEQPAANTPQ